MLDVQLSHACWNTQRYRMDNYDVDLLTFRKDVLLKSGGPSSVNNENICLQVTVSADFIIINVELCITN